MGKALCGLKGDSLRDAVHWGFQHQEPGDVFDDLPPGMKTNFNALTSCARNHNFWSDYCNDLKPKKWVQYDEDGRERRRRSPRQAQRARERSLTRETLRRQLVGTRLARRPAPDDIPPDEVHVYTDGSASIRRGRWGAGCGVWFGDKSEHNISAIPPGRQTNNRAELVAVILAIRKVMTLPRKVSRLTVHSDSRLCIDGINKWLPLWEADGWTRMGHRLENADLWKVTKRVMSAVASRPDFSVKFNYVPAHVGIYGNERADRLAKAAARRAHTAAARSREQREDQALEALADSIVAALTAN